MTIYEIYSEAGLSPREEQLMAEYLDFNDDFYGSSAYDKLKDYFCGTGEMPHGVAKFETGEADVWILEKLEVIFEAR